VAETRTYDVVVAGGGPGGLAAARAAAVGGASVAVVEQNKEIGSPIRTTGGTFVRDMEILGIPDHLYHVLHKCRYVSPSNSACFEYEEPITCVLDVRGAFQYLAERAVDAGATINVATSASEALLTDGAVTGVRTRSFTGEEVDFTCKIVVDATGYRSQLVRQTGVISGYTRFGVGSEYDMYAPHCNQDEAVLVVGTQIAPAGYAWVFPWGRKRVRVGVGILHSDSDAHPDRYLDRFVERSRDFGVDLRAARPIEYHFGLVPSDGMPDNYVGDGIMAVGDAAGQLSAIVGEGIRWAIKAGSLAGRVAAEAVQQGDCSKEFLQRYPTEWSSRFGRNLRIAHEINKKIAKFDDDKWDRKTELLKLFTPYQFGQALQANFALGWAIQLLWSHPRLLKEGFKEIADRLKVSPLTAPDTNTPTAVGNRKAFLKQ
jgi:digeranylgeranylglycerophospholipid reductase